MQRNHVRPSFVHLQVTSPAFLGEQAPFEVKLENVSNQMEWRASIEKRGNVNKKAIKEWANEQTDQKVIICEDEDGC